MYILYTFTSTVCTCLYIKWNSYPIFREMTVLDICTCTLHLVEKLWLYKVLQVFQYDLFKTLCCFIKYLMSLYFLC